MPDLRNLTVGIDFDTANTSILDQIERDVEDIEDALQEMGGEIDEVMAEMTMLATTGSAAFDEISSEAHSAASAIDEIGDEAQGAAYGLAAMAAVGDGMLDGVEGQAEQVARAMDQVGDQAGDAIAQFAALAAAGQGSLNILIVEAERAERSVDKVGDEAEGSALKIGLLATALVALTAVGSAAIAPLVAGILALGASFGAAGIGAAAFGAVSVSILGQVFEKADEVSKLEEKIANADTAKEKLAAQKELAQVYEQMGAAQRGAVKDLQAFKDFWGEFTKQFEKPVFELFSQGLQMVQGILTGMAPTISNVADVLLSLMRDLNSSIESGGLKPFFEWLEVNAAEALDSFARSFGNVFAGIFSLLQAFSPLGASMEEGLLSLTEKFKNWAATVGESDGFKGFIEYVKTNGPVLMELFGNLVDFIVDVGVALAPLGEKLLGLLNDFTNFLATSEGVQEFVQMLSDAGISIIDNWEPISAVLMGVAGAVLAFKTITMGLTIIKGINALMIAWRAGTLMQTIAMWGLNASLLANPLTWIAIAIGAVIAIGVLLYQNWDTVKAKAGELWSWLTEKWSSLVEWTKQTWSDISNAISEAWDAAVEWVVTGVQSMVEGISQWWDQLVTDATMIWDILVIAIQALWSTVVSWVVQKAMDIWTGLVNTWNMIVTTASELWNILITTIQALWSAAVSWVVQKATDIWTGLVNIWNMIVTTASELWNLVVTTIIEVFTQLWAGIVSIATSIWTGIVEIFTMIQTTAVTIWNAIVTAITTIFSNVWSFIVTTAMNIWTSISTTFNNILTTAITIWTAVSTAIQTFFRMAWNFVVQIATQIWNTIVTYFNQVLSTAQQIWNAVTSAIQSAFRSAVDIVIRIATSIYDTILNNFNQVKSTTENIWNSVKTAIGNAMDSAKTAVSNFFSPLFNFIDRAKGAWDGFVGAIKNFKMPKLDIPSASSIPIVGKFFDGSHATGLAQVPFDGYRAELHKDEAVLTAQQSNALRDAGILGTTGSKPKLNLGKDSPSPSNDGGSGGSSSSTQFAPQVTINIHGGGDNADVIAQKAKEAAKQAMQEFWNEMNLAT